MASIVDDRGFNQGFVWSPTQAIRMQRRADAILEAVPHEQRARLMELGCGTGELSSMLARDGSAQVTGVDLCVPFVEQATRQFGHAKLSFLAADLSKDEEIARLGAKWSAIVGNGLLHHLYHHIDSALPRLRALLQPGGRFVFFEPNLFNPYVFAIFSVPPLRRLAKLEPDEMAFTPRWIIGHLQRAGFTDVKVSFRDFLVPNLPMALVPAVTRAGAIAEKLPLIDRLAQSLFIEATNPALS